MNVESALTKISARIASARAELAVRRAKYVAGLSDDQLSWCERGLTRRLLIGGMVLALPRKFQRAKASDIDGVIELRFADASGGEPDRLQVTMRHGRCTVRRGGLAWPDSVATMRIVDLVRLAAGSADAGWLVHDGRITLSGDAFLFVRFPSAFGLPTRPVYAEPRGPNLVP